MNREALSAVLSPLTGKRLATELVDEFMKIRHDCATKTLERASAGKFVETFVQCLQEIANGKHLENPNVDGYLSKSVENELNLPIGLRLCGSRIARSMYTLRNKRNIAHKGNVDPNVIDLEYLHQGAIWILAELIREASNISMEDAGSLVERVRAPVGTLVEEIDGVRLIHAKTSLRAQILILLHSCYPEYTGTKEIQSAVSQTNANSIRGRVSELKNQKLIIGDKLRGYRLTTPGYEAAVDIIMSLSDRN